MSYRCCRLRCCVAVRVGRLFSPCRVRGMMPKGLYFTLLGQAPWRVPSARGLWACAASGACFCSCPVRHAPPLSWRPRIATVRIRCALGWCAGGVSMSLCRWRHGLVGSLVVGQPFYGAGAPVAQVMFRGRGLARMAALRLELGELKLDQGGAVMLQGALATAALP